MEIVARYPAIFNNSGQEEKTQQQTLRPNIYVHDVLNVTWVWRCSLEI